MRSPTPAGTAVSAVQVVPESVVPMMTGLPKMPNPTAVQSDVVGHEIPLRPLTTEGIGSLFQAWPALDDASTELTPAAKHSAVLGHDAEVSWLVPSGGVCSVQLVPPLMVLMIVEPAPVFPLLPTAMQS